jgi:hypothetical protein
MLRIAGCRQPAIRSGVVRPCGVHSRAARVEASQRSAHAPVAAAPLPRGAWTRYPDAPGRKETSVMEWMKPGRCMRILRERWKQNAPGTCDPRAFAFLGRSGWPISQRVSRMSEAQAPRAFAIAQIAIIRVQDQAAARWLQGGLAVEGIDGLHGKIRLVKKRPRGRRARTIRRLFAKRNIFLILFSMADRRHRKEAPVAAARMTHLIPLRLAPWPQNFPIPRSTR